MSRDKKKSDHRKLGQIIKSIHKHSPKTVAEEQSVSKKNAKTTVLHVSWNGRSKFVTN